MNGVHDMGGIQNMGPVFYEKDEPVFHAPWEARAYALVRAVRAWRKWNADANRDGIERIPPAEYLRMSYYERWVAALVEQIVEHGLATRAEVESGRALQGSGTLKPVLMEDTVPAFVSQWTTLAARDLPVAPRFKNGQAVRARNIHPAGHTRLPRYARGKAGTIVRDHGVHVFPDTNARFQGEKPQHVYSVRFAARELWGDQASPHDSVHIDLWDDYLDHAGSHS